MVLIPSVCKRFSNVSQANKPQQMHQYIRVYTTYTLTLKPTTNILQLQHTKQTSTENPDIMILGGHQLYLAPKNQRWVWLPFIMKLCMIYATLRCIFLSELTKSLLHSLCVGWRNLVRVSLIFAIIVSFMLFTVFPLVYVLTLFWRISDSRFTWIHDFEE